MYVWLSSSTSCVHKVLATQKYMLECMSPSNRSRFKSSYVVSCVHIVCRETNSLEYFILYVVWMSATVKLVSVELRSREERWYNMEDEAQ